MSSDPCSWTIGVEEELQIINPETRGLHAGSEQLLQLIQPPDGTTLSPEFQCCQIELATPICQTLSEVRTALLHARHALLEAAAAVHLHVAAAGTHPFSHWKEQQLTVRPRYQRIAQRYQQLAREQVLFGCHVHIGYPTREEAIQIMNRARLWLAPILALTTNSPFWIGEDTGYASFRMPLWWRWPLSGPPPSCSSVAAYDALLHSLVTMKSIEDATHLYWDLRLSQRYPTLEFRCMDVCLTVDETVMAAGLIRAVVQTVSEQAHQHEPCPLPPTEVLRMAQWQAARYGLSAELLDVTRAQAVPAQDLIEHFLTVLHPVLAANGEWEEISSLVQAVLQQGTGATRQRAVYQQTGSLEHVVDFVVKETANGAVRTGRENSSSRAVL
jgi:carboxylate-amine ligase